MADLYRVKLWTESKVKTVQELGMPPLRLVGRQKYFLGWNHLSKNKLPKRFVEREREKVLVTGEEKFEI